MRSLRRLVPYLARLRRRYVLGLSLVMLSTLAATAVPIVIRGVIDGLRAGPTTTGLLLSAAAIVGLAAVRAVFNFGGRNLILMGARLVERDMRDDVFRHLLRLPASFYDRQAAGDLTSRVINDIEGVRTLAGIGLQTVAGTGLMLALSLAGMFWIDARLSALCLIPLSVVSIITWMTGAPLHRLSLAAQDQLGVLSSRAQENFSGARVVRVFAQEDREVERYAVECERYLDANMALARLRGYAWAGMTLFTELAIVLTLYLGGRGMIRGTFSAGDFAAFMAYLFLLVWPVIAIGWTFTVVQRGVACMGRLAEIFDTPVTPTGEPPAQPGKPAREAAGPIEFRGLTFRYDEDREPALRDVSFTVEPGETLAIVGRTGSGKSTIASLLTRLYPAPPGTLFAGGRDINELPLEEWRLAVGCVPQEPFLFSDTIRENIRFGGEGDPARAADLARLNQDVERFPQKLDQMVGERGITLSGGQKQRAAIARAFVRDPAILILDDALSSVDAHTEREILEGLQGVLKGRTCLIITHRLAVARTADRIVVLDEGRVAEIGTHDRLVAAGGPYARLWMRQQLLEELGASE